MAVIDPRTYSSVVNKLRSFFLDQGFVEVEAQSRTSILAACEDPSTVTTYTIQGEIWPGHQTNQMHLENFLLTDPSLLGCFCVTTSYRDEPNPIPGRHDIIFPMFEFETHGDMEGLARLESDLLVALGFKRPERLDYEETAAGYGVSTIEAEQEKLLWEDVGNEIILQSFPKRSNPFWNMRRDPDRPGIFKKIDVILYGMETIGSAERSCDVDEMRHDFHNTSDGGYAQTLYDKFGKARVLAELEEYLAFDFFPRFGGGIGMTRLTRAFNLLHG